MNSLATKTLESNNYFKINFTGGDLSSDAGLLLLKEFVCKIGLENLIKQQFKTNDTSTSRKHTDDKNLMQMIYQILSAYFTDDSADELTIDPVFKAILDKNSLASQPTISRFINRMDEDTLKQFNNILLTLREYIYSMDVPKSILLDLDSSLLKAYGKQEGKEFNYHYKANGYHPLFCFDGFTGDLIKVNLRKGSVYSSNGVIDFIQPIFDEYSKKYPDTNLFLRGDSGFADTKFYSQCESNGCSYAIRLKESRPLVKRASHLVEELYNITKNNILDYAVVYDEFYYKAKTWPYPRRVVCKVEKFKGQVHYRHTFVVTNMDIPVEKVIKFYLKRGAMENFIKECKNGFDFASVSNSSKLINENRLQLHALAYNLFNYFRRLVLPKKIKKQQVDTIRIKLIKIAAKVVHSARYTYFKLCSSFPYKNEFYETLENIRLLKPKLE